MTDTPEELRTRVAQAREQLGATVEELAAKADVKSRARHKAAEVKGRAQHRAHEATEHMQHAASQAAHRVQEKTPEPDRGAASRTGGRRRRRPAPVVVVGGLVVLAAVLAARGMRVWCGRPRAGGGR
jgi:cobalamin biosynthesis Mg chelatase CobN